MNPWSHWTSKIPAILTCPKISNHAILFLRTYSSGPSVLPTQSWEQSWEVVVLRISAQKKKHHMGGKLRTRTLPWWNGNWNVLKLLLSVFFYKNDTGIFKRCCSPIWRSSGPVSGRFPPPVKKILTFQMVSWLGIPVEGREAHLSSSGQDDLPTNVGMLNSIRALWPSW